jgi:RsiW-degrading membrane proteinase PrsW (M82 family)
MAKNRDQTKKKKKSTKPANDSGDSSDDDSRKRTMWIVLAVLAILTVVLWYLHRQGYLQRWFPTGRRRMQQPDYSPSAPPFPTNGF